MHEGVSDYLTRYLPATAGALWALDIGGRDINGNPRYLWPDIPWRVMDIREGEGVDVVRDATDVTSDVNPWAAPPDLIITTETLEHVEHWPLLVRNAYHWLAPGGHFLVTCAGPGFPEHSAVDGNGRLFPGEHYANVSAAQVAAAMEAAGFAVLDARQESHFTYAAARKPGRLAHG